ncbi:MAG: DUF4149 domain-containing protein [Campylobacterales bacterium]|nr:DUF4149 domain-containing protein [Campylobacterales bacterium]
MKIDYRKWATVGYILILGMAIGMILFAGVVVAPVIFNANDYLAGDLLTKFQSGIIMTQIFIKLNYFLIFLAFYVFLMEGYDFKMGKRDMATFSFSFLIICTSLLFVYFYTPFILEAQALGAEATKTEAFANMHKGSELDFKILLISLIGLLVTKLSRGVKNK